MANGYTREQRRRYGKRQRNAREVAARLIGFFVFKCIHCGKDYETKRDDFRYPCCDDCIPFRRGPMKRNPTLEKHAKRNTQKREHAPADC